MGKKVKLKEYIHPEMDLLFVSLNAPEVSNKNEHWFSYSLSFWNLLYNAGIITEKITDKLEGDERVFGSTDINKNNLIIGVTDQNRELVETKGSKTPTNKQQVDRILKILDNHSTKKLCLMHAKVASRFQKQGLIHRNIKDRINSYGKVGQYKTTAIFEIPFHNASIPNKTSFYKMILRDTQTNTKESK